MSPHALRVLRVVTRLNVGGPALHIVTLTARSDPERFESLLAVGEPDRNEGDMLELRPDLKEAVGERLLRVRELRRRPTPLSDLMAVRDLRRLIRRVRPDVVETHMAKAGTLGRIAAFLERVPVVIHTFHGTSFRGHFRAPLGGLMATWERLLATRTNAIVAVSPAVQRDLQARRIGRDRIHVVPLGLDLSPFLAVPSLREESPPVVTLVARLAPVKDVPLFLEAVGLVRESVPDVEAWVVGDGPLRERLGAASPPWTSWLGNRADLPELFGASGAVALTSRSEGLPVALIEALAAGRPVVGVPVGGVVDLLSGRPGAMLTADRSARSVANALLRALGDRDLRDEAERGRRAVADEHSIERLLATMEPLYEQLVARAGR